MIYYFIVSTDDYSSSSSSSPPHAVVADDGVASCSNKARRNPHLRTIFCFYINTKRIDDATPTITVNDMETDPAADVDDRGVGVSLVESRPEVGSGAPPSGQ